jgi:hypothetical protein
MDGDGADRQGTLDQGKALFGHIAALGLREKVGGRAGGQVGAQDVATIEGGRLRQGRCLALPGELERRLGTAIPAQAGSDMRRASDMHVAKSAGKSKAEAIRALKRYLVRVLFRLWEECLVSAPAQPASQAA